MGTACFRACLQACLPVCFAAAIVFAQSTACAAQPQAPASPAHAAATRAVDAALGLRIRYPSDYQARSTGSDVFLTGVAAAATRPQPQYQDVDATVDRALNGRLMAQDGAFLIHLHIGSGSFSAANRRAQIFRKDPAGLVITFGRFNNPPAQAIARGKWHGYESVITCSTYDEETGFHAAAGQCYWALISDGKRYVLLDTQPLSASEEKTARHLLRSLAAENQ